MPHRQTIAALSEALRSRAISSVELTQHFLARIDRFSDLNALITTTAEQALESAAAADRELDAGQGSRLTGIPIVHKDIFCTEGVLTTCGSRILSNFVSPYDATVVSRLKSTGVVSLGKTNMDEFAMGSSNETSFFGPVKNPWSLETVPGGSSGGSAAAVAAGLAAAATGTDTGGSIRQPASFCGLTGLKPSYGRVSRFGMVAFASSLDQGGPLARSAEDAAILIEAMAGFDERDSTSLADSVPAYTKNLDRPIEGLRIGIPAEFFDDSVDNEVLDAIRLALAEFEKLGATLVDVSLPASPAGIPCYYVIAPAEASSNLSRFDGVRYGYRADQYDGLVDLYEKSRTEGFGAEVKRRLMIGTYALSAGYYDAYYLKALKIRRIISDDFKRAFQQCDVLMGPTTPTTAFRTGEKTEDPVAMYLNDIFTNTVNLAGLPAVSIPAGFDRNNLPIGLQIIGPYLGEGRLLNVAHQYQQMTDWHQRRPEAFDS